jgi:hypothetical protein
MLKFREIPSTGLGYAKDDTEGSAIGRGLASQLADLASDIIDAGVDDPAIFELVGLLQEGMGADRISDMTVSIILPDLLAYTERIAHELGVATEHRTVRGTSYNLPIIPQSRRAIILLPQAILRHLPVAESWEDIDTVASHNADLRQRVNPIIGSTWRRATGRQVSKADLRETLLKHPELLKELLEQYKRKPAAPYDFLRDPAGQQVWYYTSQEEAERNPLDLRGFQPVTLGNVVDIVRLICDKYRALVEDNRLYRVLYNDDGSVRHERIAQLGFFAIASAYCDANKLDLSPEVNSGPGPVDFKISHGLPAKVNVEVKLSSNQRLVHGFETQLPLYDQAEKSGFSFMLIVRVGDSRARIDRVLALAAEAPPAPAKRSTQLRGLSLIT